MDDIITAEDAFSVDEMMTSLMVYGYYCYHDKLLESILPNNLLWVEEQHDFFVTECVDTVNFLIDQQKKTFEKFYRLKVLRSGISYGIDKNTDTWHTDNIEDMDMQILCYQTDFNLSDGGELGIKCYDGIERFYVPKNGDLIILNHSNGITHKVFPIKTNKKRIVINVSYVWLTS